jgi:hypothetical protein
MVYFPRKVVFPFFVAIFSIIFFTLLFIAFPNPFVDFSQGLQVKDSSVGIVGDKVVLKLLLKNISNHYVNSISVDVSGALDEANFNSGAVDRKSYYLKDANSLAKRLAPGEEFEFEVSFPLSEYRYYKVFVMAPFTKTIVMDFALQESTLNPVRAEASLPSKLFINETYKYPIKLCNDSDSDIGEVFWKESTDDVFFKEDFTERSVSLKKGDCKTIYSTLTPNTLGEVELKFTLRVGLRELKSSKVIEIINKAG